MVLRESVVLQDLLVHKDHRVPQATLDAMERKDLLDRLVHPGH